MDVENLEDLGELKKAEFVTSSKESSDDEDLFETMVDSDMLGRDEVAQKANIDPEARKSKDVAKLLGVIHTIRKADEMQAKGMAVLEEIVGKYPDLAGLAEIIKPAKNVIDKNTCNYLTFTTTHAQGSCHCCQFRLPKIISILTHKHLGH